MAESGVGVCRYRIGFLNVQGLTIAKAVEIRSLIKGGLGGRVMWMGVEKLFWAW